MYDYNALQHDYVVNLMVTTHLLLSPHLFLNYLHWLKNSLNLRIQPNANGVDEMHKCTSMVRTQTCQQLRPVLIVLELPPLTPRK